jgi:hypothetical protein
MLLIFPVLLLGYLLLGLAISIGIARWAGRQFQSRLAPWAVFAVLFALFFGDEIYGYWHWQNLCKTEGGLHVYKRVPVEGFRENGLSEGFAGEYLQRGYRFVEGTDYRDHDEHRGQLYRYTLGVNKQVNRTAIKQPQSRFVRSSNYPVFYPHYSWANETYIKDSLTDELLGVGREFGYRGATVIRYLRAITGADGPGSSESCGHNNSSLLLAKTIPPIQSNLKELNHD